MTAQELYEIVKDIPAEAWPDLTFHEDEDQWSTHPTVACRGPVNIHLAEAAFVGAMVAWLSKERCPNGGFTIVDMGDFQRVHEYHDGTGYEISDNYDRPTLVEALAAACKEAK